MKLNDSNRGSAMHVFTDYIVFKFQSKLRAITHDIDSASDCAITVYFRS